MRCCEFLVPTADYVGAPARRRPSSSGEGLHDVVQRAMARLRQIRPEPLRSAASPGHPVGLVEGVAAGLQGAGEGDLADQAGSGDHVAGEEHPIAAVDSGPVGGRSRSGAAMAESRPRPASATAWRPTPGRSGRWCRPRHGVPPGSSGQAARPWWPAARRRSLDLDDHRRGEAAGATHERLTPAARPAWWPPRR